MSEVNTNVDVIETTKYTGKFEHGDVVRITDLTEWELDSGYNEFFGKIGVVTELDDEDIDSYPYYVEVAGDNQIKGGWFNEASLELTSKKDTPKMSKYTGKFKVGDAVRVIRDNFDEDSEIVGFRGTVIDVGSEDNLLPYKIKFDYVHNEIVHEWHSENDLIFSEKHDTSSDTDNETATEEMDKMSNAGNDIVNATVATQYDIEEFKSAVEVLAEWCGKEATQQRLIEDLANMVSTVVLEGDYQLAQIGLNLIKQLEGRN